MAREKKTQRNRSRTRVPVASRAADIRKAQRAQQKKTQKPDRMSIAGVGVIVVIVLIVLLAIAVPLRNYYHGRSEIARLHESIAAKQDEKAALLEKIDQYKSDEYIKQEARRRFGVVDEGETAYRIIDPQIKPDNQLTTDGQEEEDSRQWYEVLWDSVAEPPEEEAPSEQVNHLPIEPPPEEKADVR
ncbi:septum formation initiator family protein [Corynebacterium sp. c8Ua_181]|uniref:Septum formation initiator family protein n=1 Tax=Corynebacterium curieae TaxID=2913500 RepID=A0A9X3MAS8_9CORY|nr:septum formation initiator family protein [Corynebacterium curieae]MCZ9306886.1 septum formation initiator family protein [Corynebacterium curieae]MDV2423736.1 septum formation initiator family protein [Corynebacterium curieae]